MGNDEEKKGPKPTAKTRLFAFGALTAFVATVGYVGREGYRAATDAFVAPIILSPDNDLVLANKLKASELQVERAKTAAQIEALDMDVKSAGRATARLKELHEATSASLAWTEGLTARQASAGASELRILNQQKSALVDLLGKQERLTQQMQANLEAGLVSKVDLAREEQAAGRWKVALIETERSANQTSAMMAQVGLAKRALGHAGPSMPEQIARDEQLVRIELEMMKLESESRSKVAEKKVLEEKMSIIRDLDKQLKQRPVFRALEHAMDVAFVPYTQIDGLSEGADVYDCIWGVFHCRQVGKVTELVPGEVILPDPWGNQARGQYAVMELREHESARSKTLRVRGGNPAAVAARKATGSSLASVK